MKKHLIFVYGTLRKRFGNHSAYLTEAKYVADALTKEKFALYATGIPYLIKNEKHTQITGELYEVDEGELCDIDLLEGHPNWYKRELIEVEPKNNIGKLIAWAYFNPNTSGTRIDSGDYADYKR